MNTHYNPLAEGGNKLIAEFMGMTLSSELTSSGKEFEWVPAPSHSNWCFEHAPPFDRSWDWLMSAVEKISVIEFERGYDEDLDKWIIWTHHPVTFGMLDEQGRPMVRFYCNTLHYGDTLIQATWKAVVDFIKYYSEQNQQP